MLMIKEQRPAFRTIEGWARSVLIEAGAIRECEEHGWAKDRADPHARDRALLVARQNPPPGVSPDRAVAAVRDVLDTIMASTHVTMRRLERSALRKLAGC